jgi:hypothetical protein
MDVCIMAELKQECQWKCSECDCLNKIDQEDFKKYAEHRFSESIPVCKICGFLCTREYAGNILINRDNGGQCKPFRDRSSRVPMDVRGNFWIDSQGNCLSRVDFLKVYGVDPEINWKYRYG